MTHDIVEQGILERYAANYNGARPSPELLEWMVKIEMRPTIDQKIASLHGQIEILHVEIEQLRNAFRRAAGG